MEIFETMESEVRSYCRYWPTVFARADGARLYDEYGEPYIDFFSAAGSLNYGHNHPALRDALTGYLLGGGVAQALDMATTAKREFLTAFADTIMKPRGMNYKVQFPGPGGANAVEAALRLARKVTRRNIVLGFTGGFHGMTSGALQVSDLSYRRHIGTPVSTNAGSLPFDGHTTDPSPGHFGDALLDLGLLPHQIAAVILEVVQGEGGVRPARPT